MNFFKTLIAATLGTFIALVIIFFIMIITISSTSQEPEPYVQSNSVLKLELSGTLPDRTTSNPLDEIFKQGKDKVSLESLRENLEKAKSHDNIEGVWLEIDFLTEQWANLQEAYRLIRDFRDSSDKFVYASTNDLGYNEKGYYLATAADSIFSPPETFFEFDGFFTQVTFLTGALEKIGVEVEVTRHGKYKGAVEPLFRKELSEENEYQLSEILTNTSSTFLEAVTKKTGRSVDELNKLLNRQPNLTSSFAFKENLIDSLLYNHDLEKYIKRKIGIDIDESLETVSNKRYARVKRSSAGITELSTSNKIAVIHANGPIVQSPDSDTPFSNQENITVDFFEDQLDKIRDDEDIKALVVRINSPGGSSSTSDVIWGMLQEVKQDMPVIVSMGNVAASGGYYISMAADSIVAEPNTLTGSIGVFATIPNAEELFNDKLGITFDEVKTHEHADWFSMTRNLTPSEMKAAEQFTNEVYEVFVQKAADNRDMSFDEVDEVAQGRVWTGTAAKEQGLVDELGGLDRALAIAAEKAQLEAYNVDQYPKPKTFYELIMGSGASQVKSLMSDHWFTNPIKEEVSDNLSMLKQRGALLLLPYDITIE